MFSGVKTMYKTMGFDSSVVLDSPKSQLEATQVTTLLEWAQEAGKRTGFVTNSRSSFYLMTQCAGDMQHYISK